MTTGTTTDVADLAATARAAAASVLDPELPVLTIDALGILRDVTVDDDGAVVVTITPSYSGCPAMDAIRTDVIAAVRAVGVERVEVVTVLAPAWTTDWISAEGRDALLRYGIAPPGAARGNSAVALILSVRCPQCGSLRTSELSRFGSTACKSMWRCGDLRTVASRSIT